MQRTRAIPVDWLSSGLCPDRPKGWIPIVIKHKLRNWILYSAQLIKPHNKIPIFYSLLLQTVTASIHGVTQIAVTHWLVCSIPGRRKRISPFLEVQAGSVAQPTSYTSPFLPGRKAQVELRKTMEHVGMNSVSMKGAWILPHSMSTSQKTKKTAAYCKTRKWSVRGVVSSH